MRVMKMVHHVRGYMLSRKLRQAIDHTDRGAIHRTAAALRQAGLPLDAAVGDGGETPILYAVQAVANGRASMEVLTALINAGFSVDAKSTNVLGLRPLHVACHRQRSDVLGILLAAGADPNLLSNDSRAPLLTAVPLQNVHSTRLLLEAGADPNCPTPRLNGTALHLIGPLGHEKAVEMAQLLVDFGCDVFKRNHIGRTALHAACESRNDARNVIEFLLFHGLDINEQDDQMQSALMRATSANNPLTVRYLLDRGADRYLIDKGGRTPLGIAMVRNYGTVVQMLTSQP